MAVETCPFGRPCVSTRRAQRMDADRF
ncbi:hypothetical protein LGM46_07925 [Burkholderia arboris]|nr:hypothetical protein [Burkholderia arboris]